MKIRYNGEEGELAIIRFEDLDAMCRMERVGENLSWVNEMTGDVFCEDGEGVIVRFMGEMEHSTDWEERLRAEYWQTKIRLKKLKAYINKRIDGLSTEEKEPIEILLMQENYMHGYLKCLEVSARYNGVDLGDKGNEGKQEAGQGMA